MSKLSEDQKKKGLHQKQNTFFPPTSGETKTKKRSSPELEHVFPRIKAETCTQGLQEEGSGGTSYPGLGLGEPGLKGPRRAQVSALSFGIAP